MGHALRARGIATPRPIAVCRVRRPGSAAESYLATEWVDGAENLHLYGWRLADLSPAERFRRAARSAESLGKLIGRMHAWQISHGDLKAANVLVVDDDAQTKTYLIDAEDVHIGRRLTYRARLRDLERLATSLYAHAWVTRTSASPVASRPERACAISPDWPRASTPTPGSRGRSSAASSGHTHASSRRAR